MQVADATLLGKLPSLFRYMPFIYSGKAEKAVTYGKFSVMTQ